MMFKVNKCGDIWRILQFTLLGRAKKLVSGKSSEKRDFMCRVVSLNMCNSQSFEKIARRVGDESSRTHARNGTFDQRLGSHDHIHAFYSAV